MPVIDLQTLEKMTAGDSELLADVAVIFVRSLPELESKIRFGIENHEYEEIENATHQLRGRVGYFGARGIQEAARQLESAARQQELGDVENLYRKVFDGIDQLLEELRVITKLSLEVMDE